MSELIDRQAALDAIKFAELGCEYDEVEKVQIFNPWHRVEEPPKENGRYLVSWEVAVTTDEYKDGVWLYASMFNLHVTHWMPLPEPPKEDV